MNVFSTLIALLVLAQVMGSFAQTTSGAETVGIFSDNQKQEQVGKTPSKWGVISGKCILEKFGNDYVLSMVSDETKIRPKANMKSILAKGFEASFELFYTIYGYQRYYCRIYPYAVIEFKADMITHKDLVSELPSTHSSAEFWKKITIKYNYDAKQIEIYADDNLEMTIQDAVSTPENFELSNFQTGGERYYIKNINIKGTSTKSKSKKINLIEPQNNSKVFDKDIRFSWEPASHSKNSKYILSVYEIKPGQTVEKALKNYPCFVKEGNDFTSQQYLLASKSIERGKNYCWNVKQIDGANEYISDTWTFRETTTTPLKFPEPQISCDKNGQLLNNPPCQSIIQEVIGDVEIWVEEEDGKGKWVTAQPGMEIKEGTKICTGEGSSVSLAFGTNSIAILSSATLCVVKELKCIDGNVTKVHLFIDPGVTKVSVKQLKQFTTDFQVSTPRLTCSVRG